MSLLFGGVRQIGYVVKDIEKAMDHWVKLGVGPWFYKEDVGSTEFNYYGKPSRIPKVSIALANSGDLQIELIQQRDDAPSLYLDSLKKNGEIAQHIAYWTPDRFEEICKHLRELGYVEGHSGRMGANRGPYAYFIHPDLPSGMFEISDSSGGKAEYFAQVREAAFNWDGKDPIRRVGPPR
jgi:hypothetical protein